MEIKCQCLWDDIAFARRSGRTYYTLESLIPVRSLPLSLLIPCVSIELGPSRNGPIEGENKKGRAIFQIDDRRKKEGVRREEEMWNKKYRLGRMKNKLWRIDACIRIACVCLPVPTPPRTPGTLSCFKSALLYFYQSRIHTAHCNLGTGNALSSSLPRVCNYIYIIHIRRYILLLRSPFIFLYLNYQRNT